MYASSGRLGAELSKQRWEQQQREAHWAEQRRAWDAERARLEAERARLERRMAEYDAALRGVEVREPVTAGEGLVGPCAATQVTPCVTPCHGG